MRFSPNLLLCLVIGLAAACAKDSKTNDQGGRTGDEIREAMERKRPIITECTNKFSSAKKTINGTIVLFFNIEISGRVTDLKALKNTTGSVELEKCLIETISKTDFDAGYATTEVTFPWVFR